MCAVSSVGLAADLGVIKNPHLELLFKTCHRLTASSWQGGRCGGEAW